MKEVFIEKAKKLHSFEIYAVEQNSKELIDAYNQKVHRFLIRFLEQSTDIDTVRNIACELLDEKPTDVFNNYF